MGRVGSGPRGLVRAAIVLAIAGTACRPHAGWRGAGPADAAPDSRADASPVAPAAAASEAGPADEEMPPTSSEELTERTRHLLEAMGKDESELATDILFPRDAWLATRDTENPGKDWEKRVAVPFRKALHRLSRKEKGIERAQFVSIELGSALSQATPRRHGWRKPLWVLQGARVSFVVDGRTRTLTIREMTAWRGAWYVTRLR